MRSKSFNLEHAKAGAPVSLSTGHTARILCFNRIDPNECTIIGLYLDHDKERLFSANNEGHTGAGINLVMLPLAMVEDKPVFVGDELEVKTAIGWSKFKVAPIFNTDSNYTYRWPLPAEPTLSNALILSIEAGITKADARKVFEDALALV